MTIPIYVVGAAVLCILLYRVLYGTDSPHIKGLPEIPGLPLFGSLFELGDCHAKIAQAWAKKYGPVFQVRMGNKVRASRSPTRHCYKNGTILTMTYHQACAEELGALSKKPSLIKHTENCLCQLIRICSSSLDHKPIRPDISSDAPHLPQSCVFVSRLHNRYFAMGRVL
jgi:hypothetical protein